MKLDSVSLKGVDPPSALLCAALELATNHVRTGPHGHPVESLTLMDRGTPVLRVQPPAPDTADTTLCLDPRFCAPEVFFGSKPSVAADVYSLGCLAWGLYAQAMPWSAASIPALVPSLVTFQGETLPPPAAMPDSVRGLVAEMCSVDPLSRPPLSRVVAVLSDVVDAADGGCSTCDDSSEVSTFRTEVLEARSKLKTAVVDGNGIEEAYSSVREAEVRPCLHCVFNLPQVHSKCEPDNSQSHRIATHSVPFHVCQDWLLSAIRDVEEVSVSEPVPTGSTRPPLPFLSPSPSRPRANTAAGPEPLPLDTQPRGNAIKVILPRPASYT
jgi:serine/threonine protein kinase